VHRQLADGRIIKVTHEPMTQGGWVAIYEDITERHRAEQSIAHMARHDALTDLPNRVLFRERMAEGLARVDALGETLAVICLDLDNFKGVNDTLGHPIGDKLLGIIAERIRVTVREGDTIARLGGDEFALLIAGGFQDSRQYVSDVAQRLLDALAEPFWIEGHEIIAGASIGISLYPLDGDAPETLLKHADVAMYQAKHAGRNRYRFFVPAMNAGALERLGIEESLRHALDRNEFELYFLPTVSSATGRLTGAEVLMRWRHPERGLLLPGAFVTIAEETGLIVPIGAWLLEEACRAFARWRPRLPPGFRIAVNLSARQLQGDLVETVRRALALTGTDPSGIELELTERMLMVDTERAIEMMDGLAALGVRLSLDDFGTGYSSLAYLKRFPLDKLKIDRSFVADLPDDRSGIAIVEATLALAHSLGLTVIAEGVENDAQFAFLRRAGCAECQGYLFSPPVPADRFADLLDAGPLPGTRPVPENFGTACGGRGD
jgi:diguanylate cyclase (GGDEF)-like protein